ncbi:Uncharacterised protein [Mycobacteroides abscessus subsp. massiliense]|nr:Uncharacterised protein [Mycobacteroides abscessus subsp. massiliense]
MLGQLTGALPRVGSERRHINQPCHVRQIAGLGDHRTAIGVPDEKHRPVDLLDHLPRTRRVICQRRQWVLHRVKILEAAPVQLNDHVPPMRGTAPESVDQNDSRFAGHVFLSVDVG